MARRLSSLGPLVAVLLFAGPAVAQPEEDADVEAEAGEGDPAKEAGDEAVAADDGAIDDNTGKEKDLVPYVEFGLGGLANLGGNFLTKPDDQTVQGFSNVRPEYPGFAGFAAGGGLMIDIRFLEWVGIELDVIFQRDKGKAELEQTNLNTGQTLQYDVEISHNATHVPLLIKGSVPGTYVQPVLVFGPEFVIPGESQVDFPGNPNPTNINYSAFNEGTYTMFTFGLGFEVKLPIPIPYVQFRIPFQLRGSVNPGVKGERADREVSTIDGASPPNLLSASYKTEWQFQAAANFGLGVYF